MSTWLDHLISRLNVQTNPNLVQDVFVAFNSC